MDEAKKLSLWACLSGATSMMSIFAPDALPQPIKVLLFGLSAVLMVLLGCRLAWLYHLKFQKRAGVSVTILIVALGLTAAICLFVWQQAFSWNKAQIPLEVYIGENARIKANKVPVTGPEQLAESLRNEIKNHHPGGLVIWNGTGSQNNPDGIPATNIVIRNTGIDTIRNPHITITSSAKIIPFTSGLMVSSINQVYSDQDIRPFGLTGTETFYSLEIKGNAVVTPVCFLVTVEADNYAPYGSSGCIDVRMR